MLSNTAIPVKLKWKFHTNHQSVEGPKNNQQIQRTKDKADKASFENS